jgi:heavy metal sensor kinase
MRRRTIRARLTLWHAGVLALIISVFSASVFFMVRARLYEDLDRTLSRDLAAIENVYRDDPQELNELESQIAINFFEVRKDGRVLFRTAGWQREELGQAFAATPVRPHSWTSPTGSTFRVARAAGPGIQMSLAISEESVTQSLAALIAILALGIPFAVALAVVGGYVLAGRMLAPISAMTAQARRINAESLDERLPAGNPGDELGRLAEVINQGLARVQQSFEQLRRFTADASHELRTPLAAVRAVGEIAMQKSLPPSGYREVIGSMLEELERLTALVESLLTLTRADSGAIKPAREPVDLSALATAVATQLDVLTEEKGQHLSVHADERVDAECDPVILRQGLINLIHNAIKFTPNAGDISVAVRQLAAAEAAIEVRDTGPGIAAVHQARVFDRFYRVDDGRSRNSGGFGLGLAIARWAAEINGGRLELESQEGRGSLFRIVLPTVPAAVP